MLLTAKFAMSTFIRSNTEKIALKEERAKELEQDTCKVNIVLTKRGDLRQSFHLRKGGKKS